MPVNIHGLQTPIELLAAARFVADIAQKDLPDNWRYRMAEFNVLIKEGRRMLGREFANLFRPYELLLPQRLDAPTHRVWAEHVILSLKQLTSYLEHILGEDKSALPEPDLTIEQW
jgi:hypothetical protein